MLTRIQARRIMNWIMGLSAHDPMHNPELQMRVKYIMNIVQFQLKSNNHPEKISFSAKLKPWFFALYHLDTPNVHFSI
jgi:hypothetical protein